MLKTNKQFWSAASIDNIISRRQVLPTTATVEIPEEGQIFDFNRYEYNDEDGEEDFFEGDDYQSEEHLFEEDQSEQNEGLFGYA